MGKPYTDVSPDHVFRVQKHYSLGIPELICCIAFDDTGYDMWLETTQVEYPQAFHMRVEGVLTNVQFIAREDLQNPRLWLITPCPRHETLSLRLYIPDETAFIKFTEYGVDFFKTFPKEDLPV